MSYCRFSSSDFGSDVYVYLSADGYTIHVASSKVVPAEPLPQALPSKDRNANDFARREVAVAEIVGRSPRVPIGLPHDGATFVHATPGVCADRLEFLRVAGYRVPQFAIDTLRMEASGSIGNAA